jgi:4-hydroxybenzoate polyprenyltransferase
MFLHTKIIFSLRIDNAFLPFIFFSTLCSYSFHWYLTIHVNPVSARLKWAAAHKVFLISLFIISVVFIAIFFIPIAGYYKVLLPLAFITFMYTAPKIPVRPFTFIKRIAVMKTSYLTLVWIFITAVMPVLVSDSKWNYETTLFAINRLFLIFPICVLFDYRDREEDKLDGIKNIATVITERGLNYIFGICMLLNFISAALLNNVLQNWFYTIANIMPAILLILTYNTSKSSKSDLWYYFYLDGLMMLSGLILLIFFIPYFIRLL